MLFKYSEIMLTYHVDMDEKKLTVDFIVNVK